MSLLGCSGPRASESCSFRCAARSGGMERGIWVGGNEVE